LVEKFLPKESSAFNLVPNRTAGPTKFVLPQTSGERNQKTTTLPVGLIGVQPKIGVNDSIFYAKNE